MCGLGYVFKYKHIVTFIAPFPPFKKNHFGKWRNWYSDYLKRNTEVENEPENTRSIFCANYKEMHE